MIIAEAGFNLNSDKQCHGRLHRIGQRKPVEVIHLVGRVGFDSQADQIKITKYAKELAATGDIDPRIRGDHRVVVAHEYVRVMFGQRFSRYPWGRRMWLDHWTREAVLEGKFYSALAQMLIENPDLSSKVDAKTVTGLALRWSPGQKMDLDLLSADVVDDPIQLSREIDYDSDEPVEDAGADEAGAADPRTPRKRRPGPDDPQAQSARKRARGDYKL